MPYTDYYEEHFGKGVLARVQYKEIDEDYEVNTGHEINFGCASRLLNDIDSDKIGFVFFETSDTTMINQIKNHSDLVEHIKTYS